MLLEQQRHDLDTRRKQLQQEEVDLKVRNTAKIIRKNYSIVQVLSSWGIFCARKLFVREWETFWDLFVAGNKGK